VHVGVRVFSKLFEMGGQRVLNLYFDGRPLVRLPRAERVEHGDAEVVLGYGGCDDGLAGGQNEGRSSVRGGRPLPGRIEDPAQKIQPLIFLGDAGEVARRRVARRALTCAFEVRATVGGVAGGEVGGLDGAPPAPEFRPPG